MSRIRDEVLSANAEYAKDFGAKAKLAMPPARRFAILTCMDARLDPAKFAGLAEGDAHVIRNAGGRAGTRLAGDNTRHTFVLVSRRAGLRAPTVGCRHGHGPRLHDMRHRFAASTLVAWYRAGRDVERELPKLATYLGHVHVNDTYWYLEAVPELLHLAAARVTGAPQGEGR